MRPFLQRCRIRTFRIILIIIGLILAGYIAARRLIVTDRMRIARVMENIRQGIVSKDLPRVMAGIDESYYGFGMDYDGVEHWFNTQFRMYDSIVCIFPRRAIHTYHQEAVCSLTVWFAGFARGRREPAESGFLDGFPLYTDLMEISLFRFPDGWRVIHAQE